MVLFKERKICKRKNHTVFLVKKRIYKKLMYPNYTQN